MTLKDFNKNIIDPVKFAFDKALYGISWQELINNEITRQRDKTNNNYIGYFHQHIFKYIDKCIVPPNGKDGGWDVIYKNPEMIKSVFEYSASAFSVFDIEADVHFASIDCYYFGLILVIDSNSSRTVRFGEE